MQQTGAVPKAASIVSTSLKKDLRVLNRVAPAPGTPTSPAAKLTVAQLYEVERMAAQGMSLAQIGVRLRIPDAVWQQYLENNPDVAEAYRAGAVRGIDVASQAIFKGAENGDIAAARYYLDRLGGPQFAPRPTGPAVVVQTGSVRIDPQSVSDAMERQRKLLDGEYEELDSGAA